MRLVRSSLVALFALALFAASASAAPAPRRLGQVGPVIGVTACTCSAWQFDDLGTMLGTYKIPFDGVVVKARVQVG